MRLENIAKHGWKVADERGRLRRYSSTLSLIHRAADSAIILASLWVSCYGNGIECSFLVTSVGFFAALLFYLLAEGKKLYRSRRTDSISLENLAVVEAWVGVAAAMALLAFLYPALSISRETVLSWFVLAPIGLVVWRLGARTVLRVMRARGINTRAVAVAGTGEFACHISQTIDNNPWMGYRVLGVFGDGEQGRSPQNYGGSIERLVSLARSGNVDSVYITTRAQADAAGIDDLLVKLRDTTASVYLVKDRRRRSRDGRQVNGEGQGAEQPGSSLLRHDMLHGCWVDLGGITAVSVYETPFHGPYGWLKRLEDIAVSSIALTILAAPMIALAIGVKLSSPGPVFFKQRRYGLDGKEILVWKFRSMSVCEDGDDIKQAAKADPRITRFGAFLRSTSLDELPQFINVLQGTMSVVGPRPHAVAHNEYYRKLIGGYMLRHKVKPGITGLAQVNGWRGETDDLEKMEKRVEYDLEYIRNWSVWMDIRVIVLTAFHGFMGSNAY